jgi:hypothetical protein
MDKYLKEKRYYSENSANFLVSMHDRPPLTARHTFIRIKEFFNHNPMELSLIDLKFIRNKLPKGNARTVVMDMDIETIRVNLQYLDAKGRALILTFAPLGMRMPGFSTVPLALYDHE